MIDLKRTKIFISYSHKDSDWCDRVRIHLTSYVRKSYFEIWDDSRIHAGENWQSEIRRSINSSVVAILLVSADFLASDFIVDDELPQIINLASHEGLIIIPILVKPCNYESASSISKLKFINDTALIKLSEAGQEQVLTDLHKSIKEYLNDSGRITGTGITDSEGDSIKFTHDENLDGFTEEITSLLLDNFLKKIKGGKSFISILNNISDRAIKRIAIRGAPGTGKSLIAKAGYSFLRLKHSRGDTEYIPLYLDLWNLEKKKSRGDSLLSREEIDAYIEDVISYISSRKKVVIFIDGLDRFNPISKRVLSELLSQKIKCLKLIFFERVYPLIDRYPEKDNRILGRELTIKNMFLVDTKNIDEGIFLNILSRLFQDIELIEIKEAIKHLKNLSGYFSRNVRLIHNFSKDENYTRSSAQFFRCFFDDYISDNQSSDRISDFSRKASQYAFKVLILKDKNDPINSEDFFVKRIATQSIEMLCYLSASYIFELLFKADEQDGMYLDNLEEIDKIYPHFINKYSRQFLENTDYGDQIDIFSKISSIFDIVGYKLQAFLVYLCGRFTEDDAQKAAKKFLEEQILKLTDQRSKLDGKEYDNDLICLERSLHISQIYLGGDGINYINELIYDPIKEAVNSGFHLTYYGDSRYHDDRNMVSKDDGKKQFTLTYNALKHNIYGSRKPLNGISNLSIYTLFSMALKRYQNNVLEDTVAIDEIKECGEYIVKNIHVNSIIKDYVRTCLAFLNNSTKPIQNTIYDIYNLKTSPRAGWQYKDSHRTREVETQESIFSHIGGTVFLAAAYLPDNNIAKRIKDKYFSYVEYDKCEIIKLLTMHDIGEYEHGDIPYFEKKNTESYFDNELKAVKRLTMLDVFFVEQDLGVPYQNIYSYWERFHERNSENINVMIANDIDALDCLIQLHKYVQIPGTTISDEIEFDRGLKERIKTSLVQKMSQILLGVHWE